MAKLKRYELYEGDGEIIRDLEQESAGKRVSSTLPGKQPLGRDAELQERDALRREAEEQEARRRYFRDRETNDGLGGEPAGLFDDFDRYHEIPRPRKSRKRKTRHRGLWASVIVICLLLLTAMGLAVLPQLTGLRYRFLPNLAFANGNLIELDRETQDVFDQNRAELYSDRIYQGIYIDNVHVGGMTREEAVNAVSAVNEAEDRKFDIVISVGNENWHVNSERVPVSRNIRETVEKAWAQGRSNTAAVRGTGMTPFQERLNRASEMRSYPLSYTTRTDFDHDALRQLTDGIVNYVNRDPVNSMVASFDFNTKTFTFTEDRPGARIDPDELFNLVAAELDNGTTSKTLRVVPEKIIADVTRAELQNSFGLISTYTTETTKNENRNTNIRLSAQALNGVTVLPGEIFSFNNTTGERTAAKGYKEAAAISGGQSKDEIGGGVCQTSSTLFNAVARADLEIIERNPHAWPSSYVEKGFDATVNWPGLDFKFKNNTDWPVFIVASYSNRKVTVNLYGMSLGADVRIDLESELTDTIPQPEGTNYVLNPELAPGESKKTITGRKGYKVTTWKVRYQGNREVSREVLFKTTYQAYQETVEYNPR